MEQLTLNIIIMFLFLIMFMVVITYLYYTMFFREIIIKSLYGYSFMCIYKSLFQTNLLINICVISFVVIVYRQLSLYMIAILVFLLLMDYFVVKLVNKYMLTKSEIQFIKGDLA